MRTTTWYSYYDGVEKIEQTSTEIGNIVIEQDFKGHVFVRLNDREITYSIYESGVPQDVYMEFEHNMITRQPDVDVMTVISNMSDDDLTSLVAQLFGIDVPLRGLAFTLRPYLYRIVA